MPTPRRFYMKGVVLRFWRMLPLLCLIAVGVWAPACRAMWHCGDIALDAAPGPFLIDPVTGDMLVATDAAFLIRVNEATYATSRIDLPAPATALALDPAAGVLYALHEGSDKITSVVLATGDTTLLETGSTPVAMAVDALRQRLFVLNAGDSTIYVFEGMVPVDTVHCPGSPSAVAIDPASGYGFALLSDADLLLRFDPATSDTACFATGSGPAAIEVDPERREFYIANSNANHISVFLADSDSIFGVALGFSPTGLALNPDTRNLFVVGGPQDMAIVDTETYAVTALTLGSQPQSVCVDPLSDRGFTVLPALGVVVEAAANGDTSLVHTGGSPSGALLDPITDKCFVADPGRRCLGVFDAAHYNAERVTAGGGPGPIAINFETHKVYTPNYYTKNVTIIDGYTNAKSTLKVADSPNGVTIDPVTDDVYVLCAKSAAVVIKRSGQPDTVMASIGEYGHGMALNVNTGTMYVSNRFSRDLSVIDTQTLDTTLVRCGGYPCSVAADMENNMIYVANRTSWTLTVVSGADLTTVFAPVGHYPIVVRVNPATNTVYTLDSGSRSISAIDATTLERTKIPVGLNPSYLDINASTNTIYVSSRHDGEVTVVDGDDLSRRPAKGDVGLGEVEADEWLDRAFAVSWDYDSVSLIDGNFLSTLRLPVGHEPHNAGYDPVLEKLYVTNHAGNSVEIFKLRDKISPRTEVTVDPLAGDVAYTPTPTLSGSAASLRAPHSHGIMKVLCKVDNLRGAWQEATLIGYGDNVSWEFTTPPLLLGAHLVFVAAVDMSACTLSSSSTSSLLRISDIACYEFTCLTAPPEPPEMIAETDGFGGCTISWSPTCGEGGWYELEIAGEPEFKDKITVSGLRRTSYAVSNDRIFQGMRYWRVAAVDYPHGKRSDFSPIYAIGDDPSEGDGDGERAHVRLTAFPNPSPGGVTIRLFGTRGDGARCQVYDVSGRLVEALQLDPAGGYLAGEWSGTDPHGEALPSGVYYARIHAAGRDLTHKIILLR
jgi:DNA-binding beta-propeller fold protein YncE